MRLSVPGVRVKTQFDGKEIMSRLDNKQRWGLAIGGILLTLLLAAVFTFGSLNVPFEPKSWRAVMVLYAVSSFITAAFLIFGLILARTVLRLWAERSREQLGARFKTKMVVGAMAISLLPIIFMFIVSYSLINRSLLLWFPKPLEIASDETQKLLNDLGRAQLPRLRGMAEQSANSLEFLGSLHARCLAELKSGLRMEKVTLPRGSRCFKPGSRQDMSSRRTALAQASLRVS